MNKTKLVVFAVNIHFGFYHLLSPRYIYYDLFDHNSKSVVRAAKLPTRHRPHSTENLRETLSLCVAFRPGVELFAMIWKRLLNK